MPESFYCRCPCCLRYFDMPENQADIRYRCPSPACRTESDISKLLVDPPKYRTGILTLFWPLNIKVYPAAILARIWADRYSPTGLPDNAEFLYEYAEKRHEEALGQLADLDKKADDLTKLVAAILAALAVIVARVLPPPFFWLPIGFIGLIGLCSCLILAANIRTPASIQTPVPPRILMELSDSSLQPNEQQLKSAASTSLHAAVVAAESFAEWKAKRIRWSNSALLIGILSSVVFLAKNFSVTKSYGEDGKMNKNIIAKAATAALAGK